MNSEAGNLVYNFFLHTGVFTTLEGTKSRHESITGAKQTVNTPPAHRHTHTYAHANTLH